MKDDDKLEILDHWMKTKFSPYFGHGLIESIPAHLQRQYNDEEIQTFLGEIETSHMGDIHSLDSVAFFKHRERIYAQRKMITELQFIEHQKKALEEQIKIQKVQSETLEKQIHIQETQAEAQNKQTATLNATLGVYILLAFTALFQIIMDFIYKTDSLNIGTLIRSGVTLMIFLVVTGYIWSNIKHPDYANKNVGRPEKRLFFTLIIMLVLLVATFYLTSKYFPPSSEKVLPTPGEVNITNLNNVLILNKEEFNETMSQINSKLDTFNDSITKLQNKTNSSLE